MPSVSKRLALIILMVVLLPAGLAQAKKQATSSPKPVAASVLPAVNGMVPDMMLGAPSAKITIIGYVSASCPHCGDWYKETYPYIFDKYIRTGQVKFIYRESMAPQKQYAMSAYLIGRCLVAKSPQKNDATVYFTVLDAFFNKQDDFYATGRVTSALNEVSIRTGQSLETLRACIGDANLWATVSKSSDEHLIADDVNQVPTFFVNGKRMSGQGKSDFDAAISAATKGK